MEGFLRKPISGRVPLFDAIVEAFQLHSNSAPAAQPFDLGLGLGRPPPRSRAGEEAGCWARRYSFVHLACAQDSFSNFGIDRIPQGRCSPLRSAEPIIVMMRALVSEQGRSGRSGIGHPGTRRSSIQNSRRNGISQKGQRRQNSPAEEAEPVIPETPCEPITSKDCCSSGITEYRGFMTRRFCPSVSSGKELWRPCHRGIKRAMRGPLPQREWMSVEGAFDHNADLCRFMRGLILENQIGGANRGSWRRLLKLAWQAD